MWLVLVIFALTLLYYVVQRQYNYWRRQGIPGPTPLPFIGNVWDNIIGKKSIGQIMTDIYSKYDDDAFVGVYRTGTPCLLIRDIDFLRNIEVKDFKHFHDNEIYVDKNTEPLFGRNPFAMRGEDWKKTRAQLSPCFSSGKMKNVFLPIDEIAKRLVKYVANSSEATSATGLESKELCSKFTIDNVAVCVFGLEANSFEESSSEFSDIARRFVPTPSAKLLMLVLLPAIANLTPAKLVPQDVEDRIIELVRATVRYRKDNNVERNDMLDFMIQLSKTNPSVTDLDLAAYASNFIGDGYETSSHVLSFLLFELASNPEAQAKLRDEINTSFEKNNQQLTYDSLQELVYLDACFNETVRKNAPLFTLTKICTERYTYTPSNTDYKQITVTVEPGTPIILPIQGTHSDPKYFHSPEKYKPERFLKKDEIKKFTFIPFGEGPRSCLGQRFGVLQVKIGTAHLVKNFAITLNPKTKLPLSYDPWYFQPKPKGGLWLNFKKL